MMIFLDARPGNFVFLYFHSQEGINLAADETDWNTFLIIISSFILLKIYKPSSEDILSHSQEHDDNEQD